MALVTPFNEDKTIDFEALEKVINYTIDKGIDFLVSLGTTGESATLTKDEKIKVVDFTKKINNNRLPLVVGIGGNNTAEILQFIKEFDFDGVQAILSVSPYYNKPSQEGIFQHFKAIANEAPVPVILYNVPSRTSSNITAQTTLRLARECPNVTTIKEASGIIEQCMEIVQNRPEGFSVLSGDDLLTLPLMSCGFDGVISVIANAYPSEFSSIVKEALAGNFEAARQHHYRLLNMMQLLFADGNPGGVKAALSEMGLCKNILRLPCVPVNEQVHRKIKSEVEQLMPVNNA